uniref:BHLH domain-containing protein n=1 Tax=Ditylenchus dipsaci TaxID=166011 RepID=A0A915EGW3_9BILA
MTPTSASYCQVIASTTTTMSSLMSNASAAGLLSGDGGGPGVYRKRKYTRHQKRSTVNVYRGATADIHTYDNDLLSEDDEDEIRSKKSLSGSPSELIDEDRRAHHNELERRRRDHIKDHFTALKNSIPLLEGEKSSRALILKRAVDYISLMQAQLKEYKLEMERQSEMLALAKPTATSVYNKPAATQQSLPSSFSLSEQHTAELTASAFLNRVMHSPSTSPVSPPSAFAGALPFSATTPSILSTSTATNISTRSPMYPGMASNPSTVTNHLSNPTSDSLRLTTSSESVALNNSTNLTSFLSSLLIQNHPLLSQLQFQQQQKQLSNNLVITTSPVLSAFGPASTGIDANCNTANENYIINSSLLAEAQRARLLASTLALRERQLAAAVASKHLRATHDDSNACELSRCLLSVAFLPKQDVARRFDEIKEALQTTPVFQELNLENNLQAEEQEGHQEEENLQNDLICLRCSNRQVPSRWVRSSSTSLKSSVKPRSSASSQVKGRNQPVSAKNGPSRIL